MQCHLFHDQNKPSEKAELLVAPRGAASQQQQTFTQTYTQCEPESEKAKGAKTSAPQRRSQGQLVAPSPFSLNLCISPQVKDVI